MAVDYAALRAELAKPAYAGMSDAQIVATLNVAMPGPSARAPISAILDYLRSNGLWLPIKAAAGSNGGAAAALDIFQDPHTDSIDLTLPAATALLGALVAGSLLTQAQADALAALCATTTSIAAGMGFADGVTVEELAAARKWG